MAARLFISVALVAFLCWASLSGASDTSPEVAFVKKTISSHDIVIFSKSYCPYESRSHILIHLFCVWNVKNLVLIVKFIVFDGQFLQNWYVGLVKNLIIYNDSYQSITNVYLLQLLLNDQLILSLCCWSIHQKGCYGVVKIQFKLKGIMWQVKWISNKKWFPFNHSQDLPYFLLICSIILFLREFLCRYCKRAKAVFKELNQVPHVIELNERGLFTKS